MALSPASDTPGPADKDAAITRLLARVDELSARLEKLEAENFALNAENAALRARVAELEARLGLPPKTPDNSSTPPSQGRKASDDAASKPKGKPHDPAASCSSSSPTATSRRPTTAPSALRPCTVFRKITNGFRTEWGAKLYANIRSVIETARRRAIGALEAIRLTLAGMPLPNLA
jgi:hypothetical protein